MSIAITVEFEQVVCVCGFVYAVPSDFRKRQIDLAERGGLYCPKGCSWHYLGKSKDDQISDLKFRIQERDNRLEDARKKQERLERRIKRGVCPYCKRTFGNVAAHMAAKHKGCKS